jgi:hypothetical protein
MTYTQSATERCGQTLGTSSTYQNKKKCPETFNSWDVWKSTFIISAQNNFYVDRDSETRGGRVKCFAHDHLEGTIYEQVLYPYHLKRAQGLMPADFPARENSVIVLFSEVLNICRIWGFHSDGYEEYHLLGYDAVQSVWFQPTFRRNIASIFMVEEISSAKNQQASRWKAEHVFAACVSALYRWGTFP